MLSVLRQLEQNILAGGRVDAKELEELRRQTRTIFVDAKRRNSLFAAMLPAAGYSILLSRGGDLGGALLIFIVAKMLGK